MADPLVARCLYSGKGYMIHLNQCMSYSELYEDIFRTFQFLEREREEMPSFWRERGALRFLEREELCCDYRGAIICLLGDNNVS